MGKLVFVSVLTIFHRHGDLLHWKAWWREARTTQMGVGTSKSNGREKINTLGIAFGRNMKMTGNAPRAFVLARGLE
jgi:hypothetical protein